MTDRITPEQLRKTAYELYRLDWMQSHGHTVNELVREIINYAREDDEWPDNVMTDDGIDEAFAVWEQDIGLGGEIWACFDEFLDAEYQDADYMTKLLKSHHDLLAAWREDVEA